MSKSKNILNTPVEELSLEDILHLQTILITKLKIVTTEIIERGKLFYNSAYELYKTGDTDIKTFEIMKSGLHQNQEILDFINQHYE